MSEQSTELRETVRQRYAAAAVKVTEGGTASGRNRSRSTRTSAPPSTPSPSATPCPPTPSPPLGCGDPTAVADLHEGERILDLGSGGGIDVLLSARRVGPTGRAYGLNMTDEMLALALTNAKKAGATKRRVPQGHHRGDPAPPRAPSTW